MTPFRQLVDLFWERFFWNDLASPNSDSESSISQTLGLLAVPGFFVSMYLIPRFMQLSFLTRPVVWDIRTYHLFFVAYSFAVVGFAALFQWDSLFPERRDFLIIAPLPVSMSRVFAAKLAALGRFLLLIIVAVNAASTLLLPVFSLYVRQAHGAGVLRLMLAHVVGVGAAAAFSFFAIAAIQGLLINLLSPRIFRTVSAWIQTLGMCAMIGSILLYPVYSQGMKPIAVSRPELLYLFPPFWFTGLYESMLPHPDAFVAQMGSSAWKALTASGALFALTYVAGYGRHYRRTMESETTAGRRSHGGLSWVAGWLQSPQERAVYYFIGQTMARSLKHRLFLAVYLAVGLSIGVIGIATFRHDHGFVTASISREGLRALPLLITFFVLSGLRASFQFPMELASNWVFRTAESDWSEPARLAIRKRVLLSGLAVVLLLFVPLEIYVWGWWAGVFHTAFQLASGALLVEALFWTFDKIPFTCSYFPGAANLVILAGVYLYGFTSYGFKMASLEAALDNHPLRTILFFASASVALAILWRLRRVETAISFDAEIPAFQRLELN